MKKMKSLLLAMIVVLSLTACSKSDTQKNTEDSGKATEQIQEQKVEEPETDVSESKKTEQDGTKKILVAYFSWADNAVQDDIDAMTSPQMRKYQIMFLMFMRKMRHLQKMRLWSG